MRGTLHGISKAFEKVWHEDLIVSCYVVDGNLLKLLENFITGRQQRVVGQTYQWQNIFTGVPQGSVLGPLLFLI